MFFCIVYNDKTAYSRFNIRLWNELVVFDFLPPPILLSATESLGISDTRSHHELRQARFNRSARL